MPHTASNISESADSIVNSNDESRISKQAQRSIHWRLNGRLLWISGAVVGLVAAAAILSYQYHIRTTAETFRARAATAAEAESFEEQSIWLNRYIMLLPNDDEAIFEAALAANQVVDSASPANQVRAILDAIKQSRLAIGRLGDREPKKTDRLRRLLIQRLLLKGGIEFLEVERQVLELNASKDDPEATKWLALALIGQVNEEIYKRRVAPDSNAGYWEQLSNRKPGDVLLDAIELNYKDVELIASLVEVSISHPEVFAGIDPSNEQHLIELNSKIERVLQTIEPDADSHKQLVCYRFESARGNEQAAIDKLVGHAEEASQRLKDALAKAKSTDSATVVAVGQRSPEFWDFALLMEVASKSSDKKPELAKRYFDVLTSVPTGVVPNNMLENVFLMSGQLSSIHGDSEQALKLWMSGLETVNPDSVELLGSVARVHVDEATKFSNGGLTAPSEIGSTASDNETIELARKSVEGFRVAVESASRKLANMSTREIDRIARRSQLRELAAARWRVNIFDALLAIRSGRSGNALQQLQDAWGGQAQVLPSERITVALQLAALHQQNGAFDSAARVLDQALEIIPGSDRLRAAAAEAWGKTGNDSRADEHWQIVKNSGAPLLQAAALEAGFNRQLGLPVEQQDFNGIRVAAESLLGRLTNLLEAETLDVDENGKQAADVERAIRQIERLKILLPPSGMSFGEHVVSDEIAQSALKLAERYPDAIDVQIFVAERMAATGNSDQAQAAIERVAKLPDAVPLQIALVRARVSAIEGDLIPASQALIKFANENLGQTNSNDASERVLTTAADYAFRAGDVELAFDALNQIAKSQRSLNTQFLLVELSQYLPPESDVLKNANVSKEELVKRLRTELSENEGSSGSNSKYLDAFDLILELERSSEQVSPDNARLRQAKLLVNQLIEMRPRWGRAMTLRGRLSAIEGNRIAAVDQLRTAIAAGDNRPVTRQKLWALLIALGRENEVEEEIRTAQAPSGHEISKDSLLQIDRAQRQGDFSRSLDLAREQVERQPEDLLANLVHAYTATQTAKNTTVEQERASLFDESKVAIEKAASLPNAEPFPIHSAWLMLLQAQGDREGVLKEIERINESTDLDEFQRLVLASRGYLGMNDFKSALPLLIRADENHRSTSQIKQVLSGLYGKLNEPEKAIEALRGAYELDPKNVKLRNELAQSLATRKIGKIDWQEIKKLLETNGESTNSNRFLYAVLMGARGTDEQADQAAEIFRELIGLENAQSDDAARVLAGLLRKRIQSLRDQNVSGGDAPAEQEKKWVKEVRDLYEDLLRRGAREVIDLYRYADFLLNEGGSEYLNRVERLVQQLKSNNEGALAALEIEVRFAEKNDQIDEIPDLVSQWATRSKEKGLLAEEDIASIAGGTLVQLGFLDQGLEWAERAYQVDRKYLTSYVLLLNQTGQVKKALEVSQQQFQQDDDVRSAVLLAETILAATGNVAVSDQQRQLVSDAAEKYPENAALLEAIATLSMQEQDYEEAVRLYLIIDQLEPNRLRTLNNLAMALSELPGRAVYGIEPIERAIKLAGEVPELLDTKGTVLLRANKLDEAEQAFRKAIEKSTEPRYQFHLILTLLAQDKTDAAKVAWSELDQANLQPAGLTPSERERLSQLKDEFESTEDTKIKQTTE